MRQLLYGGALAHVIAALVSAQPATTNQEPPKPEGELTSISMNVSRVVLYVTVREGKTGFVGDLTKDNFTIKEDGKLQEIKQFSRDDVPVAVGLVIDNSQSMLNKRDEVVSAGKAFVRASNPNDEMFVVHFNEEIMFALPRERMFTSNREELDRALDLTRLQGHTALYNAIQAALDHLKNSTLTKRALFVISDGGDNRSATKVKDVVKAADLSGALFYGIGIYDALDGDANPGAVRRLAEATGGEAFFPQSLKEISDLCDSIARDLRNQYTLVYAPPDRQNDATYHRVEVSVKDPRRRKLKVTTRSGYYGSAAPGEKTGQGGQK